MNQESEHRRHSRSRLYRDREHALLAGVCAGLAEHLGFNRVALRLVVIALAIPFSMVVIIGYIIMAIVIPAKPKDLYQTPEQEEFWRDVKSAPRDSLGRLRHRFRNLEQRLQRMEAWVTSREYELDRELEK